MNNTSADKSLTMFMVSASRGLDDGRLNMLAETAKIAGFKPKCVCFSGGHGDNEQATNSPSTVYYTGPAPLASWPGRLKNFVVMATASLLGPILPEKAFISLMGFHSMAQALKPQLVRAEEQENTPNFILAKHWTALPGSMALAKRTGAKLWFDINEVFEAEHAHKVLWRWAYLSAIRRLSSQAKTKASILTVTSQAQMDHEGNSRWLYLPNHKRPSKLKNSKVNNPIRLVYAGLIEPNRSLDQIVKAISKLRRGDITLDIIGYGSARYISKFEKRISELGIDLHVSIHRPVSNHQLVDRLASYDIGLCLFSGTSNQYALSEPNKIYEYLAAGLGIIASRNAGISGILKDHPSSKLLPHKPDITNELEAILNGLTIKEALRMKIASGDLGESLSADIFHQKRLAKEFATSFK